MVDPASADVQAILQQVGVSYDVVIFYVSSNLVGKRVRETRLLPSDAPLLRRVASVTKPTDGGRCISYLDPAPHSVHRVYDT